MIKRETKRIYTLEEAREVDLSGHDSVEAAIKEMRSELMSKNEQTKERFDSKLEELKLEQGLKGNTKLSPQLMKELEDAQT